MPHVDFEPGNITATQDGFARELIPGVTPGGQFAGKAKPALLLEDAYLVVNDVADSGINDMNVGTVELKLSQENDLTPGLLIPIGQVIGSSLGTAEQIGSFQLKDLFKAAGTIWAPRKVGLRHTITGWTTFNVEVHLEYRRIILPWRDWFVHWELLDGVVDNSRDY